jgi:hypothetical protein
MIIEIKSLNQLLKKNKKAIEYLSTYNDTQQMSDPNEEKPSIENKIIKIKKEWKLKLIKNGILGIK